MGIIDVSEKEVNMRNIKCLLKCLTQSTSSLQLHLEIIDLEMVHFLTTTLSIYVDVFMYPCNIKLSDCQSTINLR